MQNLQKKHFIECEPEGNCTKQKAKESLQQKISYHPKVNWRNEKKQTKEENLTKSSVRLIYNELK